MDDSPRPADRGAPGPPGVHKILVPTDFSENSHRAWPWVKMLANALGAEVHLLHVVCPTPADSPEMAVWLDLAELDRTRLHQAREKLEVEEAVRDPSLRPASFEARLGDPAGTIDAYARELGADLVVLSTHQQGWWEALMTRTTSEAALAHAPCPVLVLPAAEELGVAATAATGTRPAAKAPGEEPTVASPS